MIESNRKTKDLDFSIKEISNQVDDATKIIRSVLEIEVDDGILWKTINSSPLNHPEMDYPGVRLTCHLLLGKMRGAVRMDLAMGDVVAPVLVPLERMRYKNVPIFGKPFELFCYPPETIFSEKLQIALKKRGQNTRMKDYYDLYKLLDHGLNSKKVKKSIHEVFTEREMPLNSALQFEEPELLRLQTYWEHFLKREKIDQAPRKINEIIEKVNAFLEKING